MRLALPVVLALAALAAPAALATNVKTYPNEPYHSKAPVEGFRELYVDPAQFPQSLAPVAPLAGPDPVTPAGPHITPTNELRIPNDTIGFVKVTVNGVDVGVLTPMVTGVIHGVKPGQYDVSLTMANQYVEKKRLSTLPTPPPKPESAPK